MPSLTVLQDADIYTAQAAAAAVAAVRNAVSAHGRGELVAPPRHAVTFDGGALVFTVGGADGVAGFRVYDTFPNSAQDQVVAVWDLRTGRLEGLAVGEMLGALRTGALGALAIDLLANADAARCAVLGTGVQARTQLLCASTIRTFEEVAVFSPQDKNRQHFAAELADLTALPITPVDGPRAAVEGADVVICATSSHSPVVDAQWLAPGAHVNTVGPKWKNAHELPLDAASRADVIATDSPQQVAAQGSDHFLALHPIETEIVDLAEVLSGAVGRTSPAQNTLFLSAGLAGTEPLVARALLHHAPSG